MDQDCAAEWGRGENTLFLSFFSFISIFLCFYNSFKNGIYFPSFLY